MRIIKLRESKRKEGNKSKEEILGSGGEKLENKEGKEGTKERVRDKSR